MIGAEHHSVPFRIFGWWIRNYVTVFAFMLAERGLANDRKREPCCIFRLMSQFFELYRNQHFKRLALSVDEMLAAS